MKGLSKPGYEPITRVLRCYDGRRGCALIKFLAVETMMTMWIVCNKDVKDVYIGSMLS